MGAGGLAAASGAERRPARAGLRARRLPVGARQSQRPPGRSYDVVAKLDADLELPPDFFERIMDELEGDPHLGIAGAPLSIPAVTGGTTLEASQPWHVRGATKFYRAELLGADRAAAGHSRLGHD